MPPEIQRWNFTHVFMQAVPSIMAKLDDHFISWRDI